MLIALSRSFYPLDTGNYCGAVWMPAFMLVQGHNPYYTQYALHSPYVACSYAPAFYFIIGIGVYLFGYQFWFGRLLSLLFVMICAWCVGILTWRFTHKRQIVFLSIIIFTAQFPVQHWVGTQKPDFFALAFSLLGLVIVFQDQIMIPTFKSVFLSAFCFVLAILCRQTSIVPPLLALYWYNDCRNYRALFLFSLSFLAFLIIPCVLLQYTSSGGFVWEMYILPSMHPKSIGRLLSHLQALYSSPVTWVISGVTVFLLWKTFLSRSQASYSTADEPIINPPFKDVDRRYYIIVWIYLLVSLLLCSVTSTRQGANLNYWLEACAALALTIPFSLHKYGYDKHGFFANCYEVIMLAIVVSAIISGIRIFRGEYFRWKSLSYCTEIVEYINNNCPLDEPCYSVYPEIVAKAGREYYFNDMFQYNDLPAEFKDALDRAVNDRVFFAIVNHYEVSPEGYHRMKLSTPLPERVYPVFLHIRN